MWIIETLPIVPAHGYKLAASCDHRVAFVGEGAKSKPTAVKSNRNDPVFDVHYQTRQFGKASRGSHKIRYALIITVSAPKVKNLYDRIAQRYRTQLEPLQPVIAVPIQVR